MKNILCYFLLIILPFFSIGQSEVNFSNQHELRLNIASSAFGIPEVTYEFLLNKESSIGLSFAYNLTDNIRQNLILTPYYRLFFGKNPAGGFFVEAGIMYWREERDDLFDNTISVPSEFLRTNALGGEIGLGFKLVNKGGFHLDVVAGFGRSLLNQEELFERFMPRLGFSLGKRFKSTEL